MQQTEIYTLAREGTFRGKKLNGKIEDTHISWVIFTRSFAFKIKKPVKLSFLNFTTLPDRKKNCDRELTLNRRFTDIYIDVVPVRACRSRFVLGSSNEGEVIDYAVQMKRMRASKRMDKLFSVGKVEVADIVSLAKVVSNAHLIGEVIYTPFNVAEASSLFDDIKQIKQFVKKNNGPHLLTTLDRALTWSDAFLKRHAERFKARVERGFKRDVHGDLHSGNIFLYKKPVLFDCIEFNDTFRQIDVLYEVAFLCMDLESYGREDMASEFLLVYNSIFQTIEVYEDFVIFNYFKCLRANVRAKVNALSAMQSKNEADFLRHMEEMKKYLALMNAYVLADDSVAA